MKRKPKRNPMPPGRREEVLERDGHACQGWRHGLIHQCEGRLEVHHVKGRGMGGTADPATHDLANLLTLCTYAHTWAEANFDEAVRLGLRIPRGR